MSTPPRLARWADLLAEYDGQLRDEWEAEFGHDSPDRYVLVERSTHDGRRWLTSHATAELAANYWVGQEYREDWDPERLIDLDTGADYSPELSLTWAPS